MNGSGTEYLSFASYSYPPFWFDPPPQARDHFKHNGARALRIAKRMACRKGWERASARQCRPSRLGRPQRRNTRKVRR